MFWPESILLLLFKFSPEMKEYTLVALVLELTFAKPAFRVAEQPKAKK